MPSYLIPLLMRKNSYYQSGSSDRGCKNGVIFGVMFAVGFIVGALALRFNILVLHF